MAEAPERGLSPLTGPPVLEHLAVALEVGAGRDHLHPVRAGLELAYGLRRHAHDVARAEVEDVVVDLRAARAREDDVHLLGLLVAVAEAAALAGVQAVERQADPLGAGVLAEVARLADLAHAELRGEVLDVVDVDSSVSVAHRRDARGGRPERLGRIRHAMSRPTASTRGILAPEAIGRVFSLRRSPPAPDLGHLIERHWVVRWDLGDRPPYRQELVTHPCVNLVFEPSGAGVFGVHRRRDSRMLSGSGWAVGVKFRPGGFSGFLRRPVHEITDRALALPDVFGTAGDALAREAAVRPDPADKVALAEAFLRARLPPPDPEVEVVQAVVADMLEVDPGATVAAIARRHAVSTRTLQRLFRRHVGVGPKWVLRRYRLQEAAEQVAAGERSDWTRLALDLGYFDHAHFIRDFPAVVGRSPAEYERQCAALAAA